MSARALMPGAAAAIRVVVRRHDAVLPDESTGLSRGCEVRSDDLSATVDRPSDAERERAAERAQVVHDAVFPQEGMRFTRGCLTLSKGASRLVPLLPAASAQGGGTLAE